MTRIAVIDGNSLMHRAFHAVPSHMMTSDGRHTNAVFGFISMLLRLLEDFKPDGVICTFDAGIPDFRLEAVQRYKAQRPPTDPDLKEQFPMIEKLLEAMRIPVVKVEGYEGDDVLGTLSAMGDAQGLETYLVTGDRDAFQLASDTTRIITTRVGLSDVKVYGPDEVRERYGIGPELVPDFIALKGDSSDNIPGVPGVGEKTAAKLLAQYGSAEGVVEHASELKGRLARNVADNVETIEAGKMVATIVRDLEVDIDMASVRFPDFDPTVVANSFKELEISSQIPRILGLRAAAAGDEADSGTASGFCGPEPLPLVTGEEAVAAISAMADRAATVSVMVIDGAAEPDGVLSLGLDGDASDAAIVACDSEKVAVLRGHPSTLDLLARLISSCEVVTVDAKALLHELAPSDSSKPAAIDLASVDPSRLFDLGIAGYLLDSSRTSYDIEYLVLEYLGRQLPVPDRPARGKPARPLSDEELAVRTSSMLELKPVLSEALEKDGSIECFTEIELPLVRVLTAMERAGLEIDVARVSELSDQISSEIDEVSAKVFDLVGERFNLGSPMQLSRVLFEKLGLPAGKKSRRGYSTDASVLASLADKHPVPGLVLEYRELSKIKSTYLDTLPEMRLGDGRIHTTFNQTIAATGRLSSSDPNLQNIPVRTELGLKIRTAFGPCREMTDREGGAVFLSADYSQIELRLLAHLSGDEGLIAAFKHGDDFHSSTAARIFGTAPEDVTPQLRTRAKAVNFGIVYGQQAYGLSRSLAIPMREAQDMIDRYFAAYPQVRSYLDGLIEQAREVGYVETLHGRKRHVPGIRSKNPAQRSAAERVAMNHPMQGSAADIIKLAMIAVDGRLRADGFESVMMLQVHDELDFSCPTGEIGRLSEMVVEEMGGVAELKVPLVVSVSFGDTWAEAK